jgi:hypothetical protein
MESLLEDLKSANTEAQKSALMRFTFELRRGVPADLHLLDEIIDTLCNMVSLSDREVAHLALQLLAEVVGLRVPLPKKLLQKTIQSLLSRLTDNKASVRMYAVDILNQLTKVNPEESVELLFSMGAKSSDVTSKQSRVKVQMLQVFQQLLRMENSLTTLTLQQAALHITPLVADSILVSSAAKETLQKLHELLGDDELESLPLAARSVMALEASKRGTPQSQSSDAPAETSTLDIESGLAFNLVPLETEEALMFGPTWKEKEEALEVLDQALVGRESPRGITCLQGLISVFCVVLSERNFKVTVKSLQVLRTLLALRGLSKLADLKVLLPGLLTKLGDNKISVRRGVFAVLMQLVKELRPEQLFEEFLSALEEPNWHVKEEIMHVFIATMLTIDEHYSYDFLSLAPHLAKLLDDPKTKIRHVATETLAVLVHVSAVEVVLKSLEPLVDAEVLDILAERFKVKALPMLRGDYIEFPRAIPSTAPAISSPYLSMPDIPKRAEDISLCLARAGLRPRSSGSAKASTRSIAEAGATPFAMTQEIRPEMFERQRPLLRRLADFTPRASSIEPMTTTRRVTGLRRVMPVLAMPHLEPKSAGLASFAQPDKKRHLTETFHLEPQSAGLASFGQLEKKRHLTETLYAEPKSAGLAFAQLEKRYLTPSELVAPSIKAGQVLELLQSKDWAEQFEGLNSLRKLIKHDAAQFADVAFLHAVIIEALRLADSLRSSLAKNAMIVLGEACEQLNRLLDPDLDLIAGIFLKKCAETNAFLAEESSNSLVTLCTHCTEARVLTAILNTAQNSKALATRVKGAAGLEIVSFT